MNNLDFSEEEIQEQLALLGYRNIPKHRLLEFKQELDELLQHGQWRNMVPTNLKLPRGQTAPCQPSPPAYIKEKVSPSYSEGSGEGFFLHAEKTNRDKKLLTTCGNSGWQRGRCDSYAQHSVAPSLQLPPGAPDRLQVELDDEDTLDSLLSDSYTFSSDSQQRRFIKRKVLRKHKGRSVVCDESVNTEASDAASCLEDQMAELDLSASLQKDFESEREVSSDQGDTRSSEADSLSLSAFDSYIRGMTRFQSDADVRPKPKSFIRPAMSRQNIKKTDPVSKYFQYKQIWETFKLPGERDRKALRREIRERLEYQPPPPKAPRVYVPNTYIVPTEKKRSALRWQIRNDLAQGLLPQKSTYQF